MTTGGIPGLRGGDHVGITVPDLAQAHEFLVDVLGCPACLLAAGDAAR